MVGDMKSWLFCTTMLVHVSTWAIEVSPSALDDPTRPPAAGAMIGAGTVILGPRLESVYLPKKGRAYVIIDGRQLAIGDELDGRRLLRIAETQVELEGPEGREKLYLTPRVEIVRRPAKTEKRRVRE